MRRLIGIHAVEAALRAGSKIDCVAVGGGAKNRRLQALIEECRKRRIALRFEAPDALNRLAGNDKHQGILAFVAAVDSHSLDDFLVKAAEPSTIVVLDGVEDPRNLGAIIRTAHAAGAAAIVIPERRSAAVTETTSKAAAGALEFLPVIRVKNINRALDACKDAGFWLYGLDERGGRIHHQVRYDSRCVLVLGGEGSGLRQKTAERCDFLVRIPLSGEVPSLNVSVAAGVALFEVVRQQQQQAQD